MIKKEDMIYALAKNAQITKKQAGIYIDFLMDYVADCLKNGEVIDLYNYAKLEVVNTAARKGRNPATNEEITIPASKKIKFTAKKGLKDRI